jgi:hypothetical protein
MLFFFIQCHFGVGFKPGLGYNYSNFLPFLIYIGAAGWNKKTGVDILANGCSGP